jgi:hypothetical protein
MPKKTIKPEAQKGLASDREIDVIVICAVRYAMTRHSYMPSLVGDFVKRNWAQLKQNARYTIKSDLQDFLVEFDRWKDDSLCRIDYQYWGRLLGELKIMDKETPRV